MPFSTFGGSGSPRDLGTLLGYEGVRFRVGDLLRVFAGPGASSLLVAVLSLILWRRRRRALAVLWIVAFIGMNVVEGASKLLVVRPQLYRANDVSVTVGFHHSFPSGHAARAAIVAATATSLWRRLWPVFFLWLTGVVVSGELDGVHTPTDFTGGLLLATCSIFAVAAVDARWGSDLERRLAQVPGDRERRGRRPSAR
jgi:membrane-associated phospholipid phosphatase